MKIMTFFLTILFALSISASAQEGVKTAKITVKGISCDNCLDEVKEALVNVKGVSSVEFEKTDFKNHLGIVKVSYNPKQVNQDKLAEAINEAGFETNLQTEKKTEKVEGTVTKINVKGIECGGCAKSVENSLKKVDGVKSVEFEKKDYKKKVGVVKVVYDPERVKVKDLEDAILKVGFEANNRKPEKKHEMKH
ncbi:copper ion binding protein [Candidatus Thermokryptus mobilis]|uniref:Copper ion binding protein n=1 Tax=Candidatus Thermokryptus mobilis TaxID=1643428 RepID=A0A0S4N9J0_9BACT|nr:copper ion binding protein [Candidatus Thermokryptus mobilis]CUU07664.1 copper ion binding protein [Candidatus Thermokryptus mobilis]